MELPIISIITPSFQQATYLPECLASVHSQGYIGTEHIVVDGGSTDGSSRIIEGAKERLKWHCSEKDRGQSHAINKGLEHATGTVFGWINSDDALLSGALQKVSEAWTNDPELVIFEGIRVVRHMDGRDEPQPLNDALDTEALFDSPYINQQSTFYALDKVKEIGGVDEALKYAMDYELWLQMLFRYGTDHLRTEPVHLAMFRMHEASKTDTASNAFVDEIAGVLYGLSMSTGQEDLARILMVGHDLPSTLRTIPANMADKERVTRMVVHFLLKWNRVVHSERRFNAMRMFLATDHVEHPWLTTAQHDRIKIIAEQVKVLGWWAFQAKRKWQHLWH